MEEIVRKSPVAEYQDLEGAGLIELESERAKRGEIMKEKEGIRNGRVERAEIQEMEVKDERRMAEEVLVHGGRGGRWCKQRRGRRMSEDTIWLKLLKAGQSG